MSWEEHEAWHQERLRVNHLARHFDYSADEIYIIMHVILINRKILFTDIEGFTGPIRHNLFYDFESWSAMERHSKTIFSRFGERVEAIKINNAAGFLDENGKRRLYRVLERDITRKC